MSFGRLLIRPGERVCPPTGHLLCREVGGYKSSKTLAQQLHLLPTSLDRGAVQRYCSGPNQS